MMMRMLTAAMLMMSALPVVGQSLYHPEEFQSLVADRRAYRAGDVLTVLVVENSSAQTTADTTTKKDGSVTFGFNSNTNANTNSRGAGINLGDQFDGKGTIQRSGKLVAQVTVVVQSIEPNGLLKVKGEQTIDVNDEKQQIQLEGKVRPVDIAENNTVISTRIADAKISYIGDGILAEKQRPGFLTRFLSWLRIL